MRQGSIQEFVSIRISEPKWKQDSSVRINNFYKQLIIQKLIQNIFSLI
jgi:hypothetical protein